MGNGNKTRKKKLFVVFGKTSTGKDTVCNYMNQRYGIKPVVSYSTREMRSYEKNGVQHFFISDQEMDELEKRDDLLAWTKFPKTGIRYCATLSSIGDAETATYILNPDGIDWMRGHADNLNAEIIVIYMNLPEKAIRQRARLRGDDPEKIKERLASESEEFDKFYDSGAFDFEVDANVCKVKLFDQIDQILQANEVFPVA